MTAMYPGSGEDIRLASAVGGGAPTSDPGNEVKTATGGDIMAFNVSSPGGTFTCQNYYLLGTVAATGAPPTPIVPDLWVDPFGFITLVGSLDPTLGFPLMGPSGTSTFWLTPTGFSGLSLYLQALTISPVANNAAYASADAHEIVFQ